LRLLLKHRGLVNCGRNAVEQPVSFDSATRVRFRSELLNLSET
jgi:hypothetical protein